MTARMITQGDRTYTFCPLPMGPVAHRERSILQARLIDELTGLGVRGDVQITSTTSTLSSRNVGDGVVGLVANPARRFTDLAANAATIDVGFAAQRYLPRALEVDLGPFNTGLGDPFDFPDYFVPIDLGDIMLHRMPVRIAGHANMEIGSSRVPLAGVDISITGIWSVAPGPDDDADLIVEAPEIMSIAPGLSRDRPAATNTLRERNIVVAAPLKQLLQPADIGATTLRVSDQIGLLVGDLLALTPNDPNDAEFIQIAGIDGGPPDEAAIVTLEHPIAQARRIGTAIAPATPGPGPGPQAPLSRDGLVGDETMPLLAVPIAFPNAGTVEISGDGVPEYHVATRYTTQTDADGHYRLPPLSRVARITLEANRADFAAPINMSIGPDYASGTQHVNFLLRP